MMRQYELIRILSICALVFGASSLVAEDVASPEETQEMAAKKKKKKKLLPLVEEQTVEPTIEEEHVVVGERSLPFAQRVLFEENRNAEEKNLKKKKQIMGPDGELIWVDVEEEDVELMKYLLIEKEEGEESDVVKKKKIILEDGTEIWVDVEEEDVELMKYLLIEKEEGEESDVVKKKKIILEDGTEIWVDVEEEDAELMKYLLIEKEEGEDSAEVVKKKKQIIGPDGELIWVDVDEEEGAELMKAVAVILEKDLVADSDVKKKKKQIIGPDGELIWVDVDEEEGAELMKAVAVILEKDLVADSDVKKKKKQIIGPDGELIWVDVDEEETVSEEEMGAFGDDFHPSLYRYAVWIGPNGNYIRFQDGSQWYIRPGDSFKTSHVYENDPCYITYANNSEYLYSIVNRRSGEVLEANLAQGPTTNGEYTLIVEKIELAQRKIWLSDGTVWYYPRNDAALVSEWARIMLNHQEKHTVMIGANHGLSTFFNPYLILNVNTNDYIRVQWVN